MSRPSLALVLMAAAFAVLGAVAVFDVEDRPMAALSMAAMVAGFVPAVRQQRNEHEPEEQPSTVQLLTELFEGRVLMALGFLLFVVVLIAFDATGPLAAVLASVALAANGVAMARRSLARQGIERRAA